MSSQYKSILAMRGVSFAYGHADKVVRDIDLSLDQGEFVGLLGANGSGKSTILKLMAGINKPSAGEVVLWGHGLGTYRNQDRAKLISYLPQSLDVNVPFTVRSLAAMGRYPYGDERPEPVAEVLELVGLTHRAQQPVGCLSGGERRRAYIAMTLLQEAGVLLLDEPLANLDIRYQLELMALLSRLNRQRQLTIAMALHDISLAHMFSRLVLIKDGAVIADGAPSDVLTRAALRHAFDIELEVAAMRTSENMSVTMMIHNYKEDEG